MIIDIKKIITIARNDVVKEVNKKLLQAYWDIGKTIVENEQDGNIRAEYGKNLLKILSKELSNELGKGFPRSNLQNMRNLFLCYPNCQTLSGELSWSHYCELL